MSLGCAVLGTGGPSQKRASQPRSPLETGSSAQSVFPPSV